MSKRWLDIEITRLDTKLSALRKEREYATQSLAKLDSKIDAILLTMRKLSTAADAYKDTLEREKQKIIREYERKLEDALKHVPVVQTEEVDKVAVAKASTLSIFDSIIFAISNWSTDGQTAPDVELACQSVLFPVVYEKVMKGNEDYFIKQVPVSALEVVRRGREFVKFLRQTCDVLLTDDKIWVEHAPSIQEWWINDGLPLMYGARDEDWNISASFQLAEVLEWRDMPASRALHFPLIFDGMELVKKHADDIRDLTGLPEFNKQQLLTRIEP